MTTIALITGARRDRDGPMIAGILGPDNRWITAQRIEVPGGQAI